jgi:hypothetical protein
VGARLCTVDELLADVVGDSLLFIFRRTFCSAVSFALSLCCIYSSLPILLTFQMLPVRFSERTNHFVRGVTLLPV